MKRCAAHVFFHKSGGEKRVKEAVFTTELKNSLIRHGAFAHKIADMPHFSGSKFRFDLRKPFDLFASYKGHPIAIENKMVKAGSFFFKSIQPHQMDALERFQGKRSYGQSFIGINVRKRKINRCIIIPFETIKRFIRKGLEKLTWEELQNLPYCEKVSVMHESPSGKSNYRIEYNLTEFLKYFK